MLSRNTIVRLLPVLVIGIVVFLSLSNLKSILFPSEKNIDNSTHQVYAYGSNTTGQLGVSPNDKPNGETYLSFDEPIAEVVAGRNFSAARTDEGDVYLWGGNDWGQLGFKTDLTRQDTPTKNESLSHIKQIVANNNHVVALTNDGHVLTFGSNFSGQLGTGDNTDQDVAYTVQGIDNVKSISAGYKFTIAVKNDGTVWGWGASCDTSTKRDAELWWKNIAGSVMSIDGGYYDPNSDALVYYDKNEYCINEDIVGILSKVPVQIKGVEHIVSVSSGYGHVLLVDDKGSVWSFGCNTFQQLGRETKQKIENTTPEKIEELKDIVSVAAGYRHSLALSRDGTLFGWGLNNHGQLGTGITDTANTPIVVPLPDVRQIVSGYDYSLALKKDGTVWGWGMNRNHMFNDLNEEFIASPAQMTSFKDIQELAGGGGHIVGLKKTDQNKD